MSIFSVGVERSVHFYAMQLVEGESLAQVIERLRRERGLQLAQRGKHAEDADATIAHPASIIEYSASASDTAPVAALSTIPQHDTREYFRTVAGLGIQAAEALDHVHQNGILHRDIKPANLLVDDTGKLLVGRRQRTFDAISRGQWNGGFRSGTSQLTTDTDAVPLEKMMHLGS